MPQPALATVVALTFLTVTRSHSSRTDQHYVEIESFAISLEVPKPIHRSFRNLPKVCCNDTGPADNIDIARACICKLISLVVSSWLRGVNRYISLVTWG